MTDLISDYIASGLDASKPTGAPSIHSGEGSVYYATDTGKLYCWTGSAWTALAGASSGSGSGLFNQVLSTTPTQSNTGLSSWLNQPASSTVTNGTTGVQVSSPAQASTYNLALLQATAPSTPYSIKGLIGFNSAFSGHAGWVFGFSDGTKVIGIYYDHANGMQVSEWTNVTTISGNLYTESATGNFPYVWCKISDDGTNLTFYLSADGAYWRQVYQAGRTAFLSTPSKVIFGLANYSNFGVVTMMSWAQGTS